MSEQRSRDEAGILAAIGGTPLVRLGPLADASPCPVYAKVESFNPGGSIKDRVALAMVEAAERKGLLKPGATIVEPTSGNTGIGLAQVAAARGYRLVVVTTEKASTEKITLLEAFGAEVHIQPAGEDPESPRSIYSVARSIAASGAFLLDQYSNPANPWVHEQTTGPEIWEQTSGRVSIFVAGIGTGGTITGVSRALRRFNPGVRVVGVDVPGSVYSGGDGRVTRIEGVGADFFPEVYDGSLVDEVIRIEDAESLELTHRLATEEGILVGASSGTAMAAALRVAAGANPDDVVVTVFPDGGGRYLSKYYSAAWLREEGIERKSRSSEAVAMPGRSE